MVFRPIIGVTMGDPAGIGPEIIVKTFKKQKIYEQAHPVVIGDAKLLERAASLLNIDINIRSIELDYNLSVSGSANEIICYDQNLVSSNLQIGKVSAEAGHAAFNYLKTAINLASAQKIHAICTAPLNKEALHKAGYVYPGHTEILAELTNTKNISMMLTSPKLNVVHVTTHVGIIDAINIIEPNRVYNVIRLAHDTFYKLGVKKPKIAVCGINPHAGENGLFGYGEEEKKIIPAIEKALNDGIEVTGPLPADTLFYRAVKGEFDIVVAMYHDQGHGPIKVLGLEGGINVTIGLPIIRTSVDHGTAFDIAGTGIADEGSLFAAIQYAIKLSSIKNKKDNQ